MALEARFFLAAVFAVAATCLCLSAVASAFAVPSVAFDEGYSPLFGDDNLVRSSDDKSVRLLLDRRSGSGFISSDYYLHGFFSASIKLPKAYTAGVVVAFYVSACLSHHCSDLRTFLTLLPTKSALFRLSSCGLF
ncbi:Os02g0696500 [Oryza sativa Japonica Group]|jgi:xyloglucan:xyloglucosyl transferase|uniref:Os02g0696500 protein n=2 Tax=Oryza sativa subsp. japonica TaxID=39947 RepID=Q6YUP4_ORYSJ|nr:hypothetical protein EE612_013067 [Oryza sativa]BAD08163.1 xyloglucan endo-1,4-beta-D-glucanase-like [Oryza sativa Japonica Group]BAS80418.1 Os02g0696500 [Oryza sativa Japonica Group]